MREKRINGPSLVVATVLLLMLPMSAWTAKELQPMTPEEVQSLKFRVSVEGVAFDVPVNVLRSK